MGVLIEKPLGASLFGRPLLKGWGGHVVPPLQQNKVTTPRSRLIQAGAAGSFIRNIAPLAAELDAVSVPPCWVTTR
jgi:hypothetical protein